MSNVSDRDNTGTVMTGANTENEIPDIHAEPCEPNNVLGELHFGTQIGIPKHWSLSLLRADK
jgi:hypothetical protein